MNTRILFIVTIVAITAGGAIFFKNISPKATNEKIISVYTSNNLGVKEDLRFIKQALSLYDIKSKQIAENPSHDSDNSQIKIFLEQNQFDEWAKKDDLSLKIAVRLIDSDEEDHETVTGVFEEDKSEGLLELIEAVVKKPISCLIIYDAACEKSQQLVEFYKELAKVKEIQLHLNGLDTHINIASNLKSIDKEVNAVIILPGKIVFKDCEQILEHFKKNRIPVFSNHLGVIRAGALGGYDFDTQEIAHAIAEVVNENLRDSKNIRSDVFDELYSQLHLNMDIINHYGLKINPDLLDEAVTVGGVDL